MKEKNRQGDVVFKSLRVLWTNVPCLFEPAEVQVLQWRVGGNNRITVLLTFSVNLQQASLSDECVHIQSETLRDTVRYSVPSKQTLSASLCLITCLLWGLRMDGAVDMNSLWFKELIIVISACLYGWWGWASKKREWNRRKLRRAMHLMRIKKVLIIYHNNLNIKTTQEDS